MKIRVSKSRKFSPPSKAECELLDFVLNNLSNQALFNLFANTICKFYGVVPFREYLSKFIPQSKEEEKLNDLIAIFYEEANRNGNLENRRGSLVEYLVERISSNKFSSHKMHHAAILNLVKEDGVVDFSIHPHDIDFYYSSLTDSEKGYECKVKVFRDLQLESFNNFSERIKTNKIDSSIFVAHLVTNDVWASLYPSWYPNLRFLRPTEI